MNFERDPKDKIPTKKIGNGNRERQMPKDQPDSMTPGESYIPKVLHEKDVYQTPLESIVSTLRDQDTTNNPYLTDAVGFAIQRATEALQNEHDTIIAQGEIIPALVTYAVSTGNNQLAEALFNRLPGEEKWLMYADAQGTIDSAQLAEWRVSLENDEYTGEASTSAAVNAARLLALTEIELHNYSSTQDVDPKTPTEKPLYKQRALAYKKALKAILTGEDDSYQRTGLPPSKVKHYTKRLSKAFVRTDLWDEIEEIDQDTQNGEKKTKKNITRFVAKATAGKLSLKDIFQLPDDELGEILQWVDARRKGKDQKKPELTQPLNWIQDQELLEELAPDLVRALPLQPTTRLSKLKMELVTGAFEEAEATYADIIKTRIPRTNEAHLPAALLMGQYSQDLEAATGAHEVFGTAIHDELSALDASLGQEYLKERLHELSDEINQLKSPREQLLAKARLARIYQISLHDEQTYNYHMGDVQRQWTTFEQQEGTQRELVKQSLETLGVRFIKRWKSGTNGGYRGYEPFFEGDKPLSPEEQAEISTKGIKLKERELQYWEQAATELNTLLGEDRYQIVRHEEINARFRKNESTWRITVDGSWKHYGGYFELWLAKMKLEEGGKIMELPELTKKLDTIFSSDA